jgi:hypothetical protein
MTSRRWRYFLTLPKRRSECCAPSASLTGCKQLHSWPLAKLQASHSLQCTHSSGSAQLSKLRTDDASLTWLLVPAQAALSPQHPAAFIQLFASSDGASPDQLSLLQLSLFENVCSPAEGVSIIAGTLSGNVLLTLGAVCQCSPCPEWTASWSLESQRLWRRGSGVQARREPSWSS